MDTYSDDQDLIARVREGDEGALAELLARYEGDVRLAAKMALGPLARSQADTMDLVQSVHRRFLQRLRTHGFDISSVDRLREMLRAAARDRATDHRRRAARRGALLAAAVASGRRRASEASPEDHERDVALADLLDHVSGFLNPTERRAVYLRLEGYSTTEAAHLLGLDPDLLRVQLNRMRQRLPAGCARLAEQI